MMPFGKPPKGHPQSGEGDQKKVIKQIKVRTIIKDDKSWIHKPDDTEGQTIELPRSEEHDSATSLPKTAQKSRSPAPRPSSGYIIRGVFTKTVDSTSLLQTHYPATFETPKRSIVPVKPAPANLPRLSASGYKVSPDDYNKKLAEASCNLPPKSATWEPSYVLSAAKKSSVGAAQDLAPPFVAKRVEVVEDEASPERSQTLLSLSRQFFGSTRGKREETHMGHDPNLESTLLDLPSEASQKRAFLEYKERNISSTSKDTAREEEEKYLYPDADRSSTWSTDSNHGSNGSQNDLDEIEITSKKASAFSYSNEYISRTQGGGYEGPSNQQSVEVNEPSLSDTYSQESDIREIPLVPPMPRECPNPYWNLTRYASVSTGAATEKRYGSSTSSEDTMPSESQRFASSSISSTDQRFGTMDSMMTSDQRSSISGYEERSVTTIVREARWDNAGLTGAKGGPCPDPSIHYSDYCNITPESTHQLSLQDSSQESSSRRCVSNSGERTSMGSKAATSQDSSSASDTEPSSNSSKPSAVICTYCCKEIRSGPKITLEHLGICCHEHCLKCGICKRRMGKRLDQVYIHRGIIHCDQCYGRLF